MKTLTLIALFASALSSQSLTQNQEIDRTFHLTTAPNIQGLQEAATVLRTVGNIRQLSVDANSATLSIHSTAGEIAVAQWLVNQLEQPAHPQTMNINTTEYRIPGNKDDVIRVVWLTNTPTNRGVQELLTVLRTVADVQKIFSYSSTHLIALRGSTGEVTMSDWLIHQLDQPASTSTPGVHQYTGPGSYSRPGNGDDVTRVFYPEHLRATTDLNSILSAGRTNLYIQKAYICTGAAAVIFRGTAMQMEKASQLIDTMDQIRQR